MDIYSFKVKNDKGEDVSLEAYKGKVLLIVNTATHCGFTPTYKEMEASYEKYHKEGFEVLDFPCNQFANQAPEDMEGINSFCALHYATKFPRFNKIEVNGENAIPLYKFLKEQKGFAGFDKGHALTKTLMKINANGHKDWDKDSSIKWNFTRFLISKKGEVLERFEPTASFDKINEAIEKALKD